LQFRALPALPAEGALVCPRTRGRTDGCRRTRKARRKQRVRQRQRAVALLGMQRRMQRNLRCRRRVGCGGLLALAVDVAIIV
jgi:hypothetical protein